ncbi:hypothetical protein [uncultured Mediterranean phage uvMED]|nr:hypothetical protein [uncultured Mediterranean phage uvMED]
MALNRKTFKKTAAAADTNLPSGYFNTALYTGNGSTQKIGGYINRAALFNGSNSTIAIPNNSVFNFTTATSISVWVNRNTTSRDFIIDKGNGSSGSYGWQFEFRDSSDGYIFQINNTADGVPVNLNTGANSTTGNWEHIVVTFDSSVGKIYLNGVLKDTDTFSGTVSSNTNGITIGTYSLAPSGYRFDGKLDQIRFFSKALSSTEVTTLYEETYASASKTVTDIFSDSSGTALYRLDGNANDEGGVSGYIGEGAIFNGSNADIDLPSGMQSSTMTVSLWMYLDATETGSIVYEFSNGYGLHFLSGQSGKVSAQYANTNSAHILSNSAVSTGQWVHLVGVHTSSSSKLYVNGVLQSGGSASDYFTCDQNTIGSRRSGEFFDGKLDQVRIYSKELSSSEVTTLYGETASSNITISDLVAYYPFNGNSLDAEGSYNGTDTNVEYNYSGTATNVTYQDATNFTPDLVWVKARNAIGQHSIFDSVRGATKRLDASSSNAESTASSSLTSFDSNGFTFGNESGNNNGETYVSWCFNAGTNAAATNNDGTISSTVKANTDAGFSIVKYTGNEQASQTVGHGLSNSPEIAFIKQLDGGRDWVVPLFTQTSGDFMHLNSSQAESTDTNKWSAVSADTFTVGAEPYTNGAGSPYIGYFFHSVDGIQKVGSYDGDGTTSGNFVETGFEPAFLMVKCYTHGASWCILDNKRNPINPRENNIYADSSGAESVTTYVKANFHSNGFELLTNDSGMNMSGRSYIYLAIAADADTTTPTVENSFEVVTYTGDGNDRDINIGFKPDFVWIKERSDSAGYWHYLFNSIRGGNKPIHSNATNAESVNDNNGYLSSFNDDGFSITSGSLGMASLNGSGKTYVAWAWKAGDHDDNLPQINDNGTIDSVVSVNDAAGFSIVKYTATGTTGTVGHGLSSAPELIISKTTSATYDWLVYAAPVGATKQMRLNAGTAAATSGFMNNTAPGNEAYTVASGNNMNYANGDINVAYCFTSISGVQKVGSYTGNGTSQSITTGFAVRFVLIKSSTSTQNWMMYDSVRGGNKYLIADLAAAEGTAGSDLVTFDSNGFSVSNSNSENQSGQTFIYLAIA